MVYEKYGLISAPVVLEVGNNMAYPGKNRNVFCIPKEKKNPDEDLSGMFSGIQKLGSADCDWSTDALRKRMHVKQTIPVKIQIDLTGNDIINWFNNCKDPELLKTLGHTALHLAAELESLADER